MALLQPLNRSSVLVSHAAGIRVRVRNWVRVRVRVRIRAGVTCSRDRMKPIHLSPHHLGVKLRFMTEEASLGL